MRVVRFMGLGSMASWIRENVIDAAPAWLHLFRAVHDNLRSN